MKKSTLILTLAICGSIATLNGCGQKGPLYLPVKPVQASTPKPAAAPAPAPLSLEVAPDEKTTPPQTKK